MFRVEEKTTWNPEWRRPSVLMQDSFPLKAAVDIAKAIVLPRSSVRVLNVENGRVIFQADWK